MPPSVPAERELVEVATQVLPAHAMGWLGQVNEVAQAALYLASDAAGFTMGVVLPVDSSWTAT